MSGEDELLNAHIPYVPVSHQYASEVEKNLTIYKKEKVFYCAAFFIVGKQAQALRKDNKICAPLFLYPARIVHVGEHVYVKVDFNKRVVNINFLNTIKKDEVDDLYESIIDQVDPVIKGMESIGRIKRILESKLHDFDAEEALLYPDLYTESKLKRLIRPKNIDAIQGFRMVPAIGFCTLKRSTATQGIISDLQSMSNLEDLSDPLRYLLDENHENNDTSQLDQGHVPSILSESQNDILNSVNSHKCTLVIGPPGTGKSYSIATMAIDFMSKGKSVLIASKTDQAVDVIHRKIEIDLDIPGVALRAGKSNYKKSLKGQLSNLLMTTRRRPSNDLEELEGLKFSLMSMTREINDHYALFKELIDKEMRWGRYVAKYFDHPTLFSRIKMRYIKWRNARQQPHWKVTSNFSRILEDLVSLTRKYIGITFQRRAHKALYENRGMFRKFLNSLSARHSSRQEMLFEEIDLRYVLETFPIWLVNMSDIHDVFPLDTGIFDLAIIDEATQCDIASCLPIIQRAKRIAIVGDPKQLRYVSFLSRGRQYSLQKKHGILGQFTEVHLDYRNTSILDLIDNRLDSQSNVCFLDEHFRSKPDLIHFSNQNFYGGHLRIMTDTPLKDHQFHRLIVDVPGNRDQRGVNSAEADYILNSIKEILMEQADISSSLCQSIGILSPFRDQVEYLGIRISKELQLHSIEKHNISCGTAYSFQGEERDIMFLSMCIDDQVHHSAVIHLNKPDVFNVSVTRARSMQYIVRSFSDQFDCGELLKSYISDIQSFKYSSYQHSDEVKDQYMQEVLSFLNSKNFENWTGHNVAGLTVDIMVKSDDEFYGINLIGYPGDYVDALQTADYKVLTRAGLKTFPLPYTYWKFENTSCRHELMLFLSANG